MFTLGIGQTTSSEMCEGIARAGNGVCLMSVTSESIVAKTAKLVKASRTELLRDLTVEWGIPSSRCANGLPSEEPREMSLRQVPRKFPPVYSGFRTSVFAMIEDRNRQYTIPNTVVVQMKSGRTGEEFRFTVCVDDWEVPTTASQRPNIDTLAARRVITDLEDTTRGQEDPSTEEMIIRLGEHFRLATRFTSFVAVEGADEKMLDSTEDIFDGYEFEEEEEESDDDMGFGIWDLG